MEEGRQDLLNVTVTQEGMMQLKQLASGMRWTFWMGLLANLFYVLNSLFQRLELGNLERFRANLPFYLVLKLQFWFILGVAVLSTFQLYLFWRFSKESAIAAQLVDNTRFNDSLRLLVRFNRWLQLGLAATLLFMILQLWASFTLLARISHFPN